MSMNMFEMLYFHRVLLCSCGFIVVLMFGYYNLLTYHVQRIFSQRMYMYGLTHNLHGNLLSPPGTYHLEQVAYEPEHLQDKAPIYMLILVSSSPHSDKHKQLRDAIRQTWGYCKGLKTYENEYLNAENTAKQISCKLYFYMGKTQLYETELIGHDQLNVAELKEHQDMVIGDFLDNYHNMTRKILFGLNWTFKKFAPKYILKTDDDVYMNVPQLINILNTKYASVVNLYGGHVYYASVIRDANHRHYLTREEYPNDWYPPYNKGAQLIMSGHLLGKLLDMSTRMKRFQIDDAYIGLLMNHIDVLPVKVHEFVQSQWLTHFIHWVSSCDLKAMIGIGDNLTPAQLHYVQSVIHRKASWFCIRFDYILYYCIFLFFFVLFVLLFLRQRYFPWLTIPIMIHTINIFKKRIRK